MDMQQQEEADSKKRCFEKIYKLPIAPFGTPMTPEQKQWMNELMVKQREQMKEPGLADRQKLALDAKAMVRFGVNITFVENFEALKEGTVFPVIMKYTRGFVPPNPTLRDAGVSLGGGYGQEVVEFTLARVSSESSVEEEGTQVEVQFEKPMFMSFTNGTIEFASNFILCNDGTVRYFYKGWKKWSSFVPKWEFIRHFPVLPVVSKGFDF